VLTHECGREAPLRSYSDGGFPLAVLERRRRAPLIDAVVRKLFALKRSLQAGMPALPGTRGSLC
jgi:hypothetical protein